MTLNGDYDTLFAFEEPNYFDGEYSKFVYDNSSNNVDQSFAFKKFDDNFDPSKYDIFLDDVEPVNERGYLNVDSKKIL